ncbi:uncharacterized protein LOC126765042 [Bactrocera neohumeralis]|uniref:uncharacterized protein LOC126765042 n=1 Tax=Bactrocera neohumeralis TaxID=98809 RepID=UPI0021665DBE|nr:uncharacterized protein LOC126765042 [Bactrocera neohumeralis]
MPTTSSYLIHENFTNQPAKLNTLSNEQRLNVTANCADADRVILLATAEIMVQDYTGRWQPARAHLRLPRTLSSVHVTAIGSLQGGRAKGEVTFSISTRTLDTKFQFWELEELPACKFFSPEESMYEKLYDDTTERASDGRFIVRLPLKKNVLIGTSLLTYEEFAKVLTEVEACVNYRPIIPTNVNDFDVLTPGHFMIDEPLKGLPDPDVEVFKGTIFQRWQIIVSIRQHFWNRWRDEYLVSLQRRSKWTRSTPNLQKDDIVIIHEGNAPPTKWKLGRVIGTSPGTDVKYGL